MPYEPINLDQIEIPESVRMLVAKRIDPVLRDVRTMLAFPRELGEVGFNLTATPALFSIIGGLSRVFFSNVKGDRESFPMVAERYPLSEEPQRAIRDAQRFSTELYKTYRNSLIHSFGLSVKWSNDNNRYHVETMENVPKIVRHSLAPPEKQLDELENASGRPDWLEPTLAERDNVVRLCPDALYWGVRRLVRLLAEDDGLHDSAMSLLAPWAAHVLDEQRETRAPYPEASSPHSAQEVLATATPVSVGSFGINDKPDNR